MRSAVCKLGLELHVIEIMFSLGATLRVTGANQMIRRSWRISKP